MTGPSVLHNWCNPYGYEDGGARRYLGDTSLAHTVEVQWNCKNPVVGRFRFVCAHGHEGIPMRLCETHVRQFNLQDIQWCPRCNIPPSDHRCKLTLHELV